MGCRAVLQGDRGQDMINYTTIENQLKTWIKTETGLADTHVISQNDNHPRPIGQYATVRIFDAIAEGHDTYNAIASANNTVNLNYSGVRRVMIGVNIYRDGITTAQNQMAKLVSSFNRVDTGYYFQSLNLGIINSSEIRDLPELVNDVWENRKQCDFFIYVNDEETINIESIEHISGTGFDVPYSV